ncbi:acyl-CoA carboxylase subunit epsilon [Streptomyces zhihengii]|uniref:Acyl-CoA carboxylase subunit epsilon n=1 Tax=Streptomyces zhihengii TaxID=1818004 RepID=A0ABS2UMA7_9ACTN|nr:acyl-CoA carboxylase subunit epsilon [Streptomyces zhihengii]MBM9618682.1 acyl-CoA carboxylase subunit epsilon [Streptomyces zhihengii]
MTIPSTACIRIEKGAVTPEELAALTVLFLSRPSMTASATETDPPAPTTAWRPDAFHAPHSWQAP